MSRIIGAVENKHDVALMPATVRLSPTKLVCCIRNLTAYPKKGLDRLSRVQQTTGKTWNLASTPVGNEAGTTPPALTRFSDGRLALTYGFRKPRPDPLRSATRSANDEGKIGGDELDVTQRGR